MSKKLAIAGTLIVLIILTVSLFSASASSAASRHKALRYRVVRHARNYDVVRGHHRTLVVRHHRGYVKVRGVRRYRVIKRAHRFLVLKRATSLSAAASTTTAILSGAPLSVGLPSSASSVLAGDSPAAANDGQAQTRWAASSRSFPQWWTVDLRVPTTVDGVKVSWYGAKRAYRYRIQTSLDGVAFTTVADRSQNQTKGTTADALTVVARYVRVTILGVSPSGAIASAYEITVNGDAGSSPPPTPTPTPTETPTPSPTPSDSPSPSATPTPSPSATPTPTPTPTPTATPTPSPTPTPTTYGCTKPVTTSTSKNTYIWGGTHDVTYSYVNFTGQTGSSQADYTVLGMGVNGSHDADINNITFDHCVFSTIPAGYNGDAFHMWNCSTTGKTIRNITFRDCWFEPQPRMVIEMNGRGGWWHDVTIDHCTFEPSGGEMLSVDMSPAASDPVSPWGVTIGGVVRGVEGLQITDNDFRGTGVSVNGYTSAYQMGLEFGCVYPYASDPSVGRSYFTGNRVGRCASAWFQCNRNGASYMTFADNVFDWDYNPGGVSTGGNPAWTGTYINHCTFTNNTYNMEPTVQTWWGPIFNSLAGDGNTFSGEDWTKSAGSVGYTDFRFTNSTYTDCHFHLPAACASDSGHTSARFPASASGTGCVFDHGHTGGNFN